MLNPSGELADMESSPDTPIYAAPRERGKWHALRCAVRTAAVCSRWLRKKYAAYLLARSLVGLRNLLEQEDPVFALTWEELLESNAYAAMQVLAMSTFALSVKEAMHLKPAASESAEWLRIELPGGSARIVEIDNAVKRQVIAVLANFVLSQTGRRQARLCKPKKSP